MRKQRSNKGIAQPRLPVRSAIPIVRQAFEMLDALEIPYEAVNVNRDCITRWRSGYRGPQLQAFLELVEALGCDLVLVPRGQGHTRAAPVAVDRTHSGEGTVPATAAPALGRAA